MPRLSFPTPETMDAEQRRVHDKVVSGRRGRIVGPLRAALHSPELAEHWQALGEFLRYNSGLSSRQSELAIMVTGRACQSSFEWCAQGRGGQGRGNHGRDRAPDHRRAAGANPA